MSDLIERLKFHGRYAAETQAECTERKNAEREEAATVLAEKDSRIAELVRLTDAIDEERRGALDLCLERNKELTASRAECEGLRAALDSCAALLETVSADAEMRGDMASWSLASVMAADARAALGQKETGA